jgi:hypothetical protein
MSSIGSSTSFRFEGQVISIAELAKTKPGLIRAATPEQIAELSLYEKQTQEREAAVNRYAREHPDHIYAQVMVNGEVAATVYDSGIAGTVQNIPGLKLTEDGQGLDLAKTRLAEIMRAIPGKVIYDHFVEPPGPAPSSNIPDWAIPKVTARNLSQMLQDMDWSAARTRMANDESIKK